MESDNKHLVSHDDRRWIAASAALLVILGLTRIHSYLLFHTLTEIAFVVVGLAVFVIAWSLREFLEDDFPLFLGIALLAVAVLHIVHLIDYPDLGTLSHSPDPPTQIWLGARLMTAISFMIAPFVAGRRLRVGAVFAGYFALDALLLMSIYWWRVFPAAQSKLGTFTTFKKVGEYVICLVFALAIVPLWRKRAAMQPRAWRPLLAALVASIIAELWFTLYNNIASTWPDLVGHLFLLTSALLVYRAVVEDSLAGPLALAMASLSEAEKMHRRFEHSLRPTPPVKRDGFSVVTYYRLGEHRLELGGDFIDVLDRGEAGLAVICGDISGHGPDAAALGARLRASWQALIVSGASPAIMVESLREVLLHERMNEEMFATLCLAWIDPQLGEITLLNFGHPLPVLIGEHITLLEVSPLPPLGTVDLPVSKPKRLPLPHGWSLFFYTDGLIEGRSAPGSTERFGEKRLFAALERNGLENLDQPGLERLLAEVEAAGGEPFADDVSVIVISQRP